MQYFKENIWPYDIVSDESSNVWADQTDLNKQIHELVDESDKIPKKSLVLVWGYYGAGKTHKLHRMRTLVEGKINGTCIYSAIPENPKNFGEIYKSLFFDQIYERFIEKFAKDFFNSSLSREEIKKKISNEITRNNPDMSAVLLKLFTVIQNEGTESSQITQIRQWLRGESLNKYTREWFGRKLKEDRDFVNATQMILRALLYKNEDGASTKPVYWIIDDCHFLHSLGPNKFNSIQKGFLDIFNVAPEKFVLIFAFAVGTQDQIRILPDLQSRVDNNLHVHVLTKNDALKYIRDLHTNKNFVRVEHVNKYYPLNEESAKKLIELIEETSGMRLLPRVINKLLDKIVRSAQHRDMKVIDSDYVIKEFNHFKDSMVEDITQ